MKKLNARGFAHHVLILAFVAVAVGAVGYMVVKKSSAATTGTAISGTADRCGSYYRNYEVWNLNYTSSLRNSDSVRNLAKQACEKGFLGATASASITKSGNWSATLQDSIRRFQQSKPALAGAADGKPGPKTVCLLGENKWTGQNGQTQYMYTLKPQGWSNNNCYSLLNHSLPNSK